MSEIPRGGVSVRNIFSLISPESQEGVGGKGTVMGIFGLPSTGKTRLIEQAIAKELKGDPNLRVLLWCDDPYEWDHQSLNHDLRSRLHLAEGRPDVIMGRLEKFITTNKCDLVCFDAPLFHHVYLGKNHPEPEFAASFFAEIVSIAITHGTRFVLVQSLMPDRVRG